MASICTQRVDESGLYIQSSNGAEIYLTPEYSAALLTSCDNDMTKYDTSVKNQIVTVLGDDQVSSDELRLSYSPTGLVLTAKCVTV